VAELNLLLQIKSKGLNNLNHI